MAPEHVQWGTITLHLDNETFRTSFSQGRHMYFDDSEYDFPHVASAMNTLDATGSVLDEDGKGGYRFDRMTLKAPFDILGFAPSVHERSSDRGKSGRAKGPSKPHRGITGSSKPNRNSFVGA